jgi:hypothetical protein
MSVRGIVVGAVALFVLGAAAEAGLPKALFILDRVNTSQSREASGVRLTKYTRASWGALWKQSLSRRPVSVSPYVRTY